MAWQKVYFGFCGVSSSHPMRAMPTHNTLAHIYTVHYPMTPPSQALSSNSAAVNERERKPKRKRVSRACDQCFLKKDRCDGVQPICTFCSTLDRTCTYDRPERKRGPTQGLRPRLEARIASLETVLGFVLSKVDEQASKTDVLKTASDDERQRYRKAWWNSSFRSNLEPEFGFDDDLVTTLPLVDKTDDARSSSLKPTDTIDKSEADDSDVDLALPPTHRHHLSTTSPSNPLTIHPPATANTTGLDSDTISDSDSDSNHFALPLLSSGVGGSSLNRGLVPRGADPNAALGGFEIEFGGNQTDEDWVRSFVPPSQRSRRQHTPTAHSTVLKHNRSP